MIFSSRFEGPGVGPRSGDAAHRRWSGRGRAGPWSRGPKRSSPAPDEPGIQVLLGSPDPLALTSLATGGMIGAAGAVAIFQRPGITGNPPDLLGDGRVRADGALALAGLALDRELLALRGRGQLVALVPVGARPGLALLRARRHAEIGARRPRPQCRHHSLPEPPELGDLTPTSGSSTPPRRSLWCVHCRQS